MTTKLNINESLSAECDALRQVKCMVAVYLLLLLGLLFMLLVYYTIERNHPIWVLATIIYVAYVVYAGDKSKSVFRVFGLLDLWEQSLLRRRSDEDLKQAFREGNRIFRNGEEVEVVGDYFVPKPR